MPAHNEQGSRRVGHRTFNQQNMDVFDFMPEEPVEVDLEEQIEIVEENFEDGEDVEIYNSKHGLQVIQRLPHKIRDLGFQIDRIFYTSQYSTAKLAPPVPIVSNSENRLPTSYKCFMK